MIQKTYISVLYFDSRSVFVAVVIKNLEGERDYGQQTLATWTFQRSHFRRGVVHWVLVFVKVQGVNNCVCRSVKRCLYFCQKHTCAHQINHICCISLFGDGQDCIYQKKTFGHDQAVKCKCWVFLLCANVFVADICNSFLVFSHSVNLKYVTPTEVWATSSFLGVNADRRLQTFMIRFVMPLQKWSATMYKTAARNWICF